MAHSGDEESGVKPLAPGELWILVDEETPEAESALLPERDVIAGVPSYALLKSRRKTYSAADLGDRLQEFTSTLSMALSKIQGIGAGFELSEVSVDVRLSVELGVELIAKAGVEGGINLTFKRAQQHGVAD